MKKWAKDNKATVPPSLECCNCHKDFRERRAHCAAFPKHINRQHGARTKRSTFLATAFSWKVPLTFNDYFQLLFDISLVFRSITPYFLPRHDAHLSPHAKISTLLQTRITQLKPHPSSIGRSDSPKYNEFYIITLWNHCNAAFGCGILRLNSGRKVASRVERRSYFGLDTRKCGSSCALKDIEEVIPW